MNDRLLTSQLEPDSTFGPDSIGRPVSTRTDHAHSPQREGSVQMTS